MSDDRGRTRLDELVGNLLEVADRVQHVVSSVAAHHDLTPQQLGLLRKLDEPVSMRAFAEERSCDPSNVTGLVDRAERLGLVQRALDPNDRRLRILTLTAKGRRLRDLVNREISQALAGSLDLSADDHDRALRLLTAITSTAQPRARCGEGLPQGAPS